jgi:CO/xanthine dehydrogenase FAD-binding subunit
MKPASFGYVRPTSIAAACEILGADEDARIVAGGQTLIPMLAMRLARSTRLVLAGAILVRPAGKRVLRDAVHQKSL